MGAGSHTSPGKPVIKASHESLAPPSATCVVACVSATLSLIPLKVHLSLVVSSSTAVCLSTGLFVFVASLGLVAYGRWVQWCRACGLAMSARLRAMYKCVPDSSSMACLTAGSGKLADGNLSASWGKAGGALTR